MKVDKEIMDGLDNYIASTPETTANEFGERVEVEPEAEVDVEGALTGMLPIVMGLVATRAGDHWNMEGQEAANVSAALTPVINKYFPDAGRALGVELTAIMIVGAAVVPRMMMSAEINQEKATIVNRTIAETSPEGVQVEQFSNVQENE